MFLGIYILKGVYLWGFEALALLTLCLPYRKPQGPPILCGETHPEAENPTSAHKMLLSSTFQRLVEVVEVSKLT